MPIVSRARSRYSPRGVIRRPIAMRLLPTEMDRHQTLVRQAGISSASLARKIYLRGLKSFEAEVTGESLCDGINTARAVNRA